MVLEVKTKGHYDFVNITEKVSAVVRESGLEDGVASVFVTGTTAALTIMEYEEGIIKDLKKVFESWAPEEAHYEHHKKWSDHNGAAHIKSAILGTDLSLPIQKGSLVLGEWQEIVLIDFDEKPRTRKIVVKIWKTS